MEQPIDLEERFEALQDELNLLKNEIKQTLVDLREYIMKDRTITAQGIFQDPQRTLRPQPEARSGDEQALTLGVPYAQGFPGYAMPPSGAPRMSGAMTPAGPPMRDFQAEAHSSGALDAVMLGNLIWWLGTVKRRGLALQQISPFLEAYEMSGHLTPSMAKLILRSMAELDTLEPPPPDQIFSPHDYADALLQLHDIICTPGYQVDRLVPLPPLLRPNGQSLGDHGNGDEGQDPEAESP